MSFNRDVHLCDCAYELEPLTGFTYSTTRGGQWMCKEPPRLAGPAFAPPDEHLMRDPTLATSWSATGGTPVAASGFRSLVRPWQGIG